MVVLLASCFTIKKCFTITQRIKDPSSCLYSFIHNIFTLNFQGCSVIRESLFCISKDIFCNWKQLLSSHGSLTIYLTALRKLSALKHLPKLPPNKTRWNSIVIDQRSSPAPKVQFLYQTSTNSLFTMSAVDRNNDVDTVRRSLDAWKEILVAAKKVVDWEQNFYPGIIVGVVTFKVGRKHRYL